jgi:hypothetical protein
MALQLQLLHHVLCAFMIGIVAYKNASDGNEMFKHVKFCMSVILFHSYTWCMTPVLLCKYSQTLTLKDYTFHLLKTTVNYDSLKSGDYCLLDHTLHHNCAG